MTPMCFVLDAEETALASRLIAAAVGALEEPYLKLPPNVGVAAVADANGNVWAGLTVQDADGFRTPAHAVRKAVSDKVFARRRDDSPIVMAATLVRDARRRLVLPCGGCLELLATQSGRETELKILGLDDLTGSPALYPLSSLLPKPKGTTGWLTDPETLFPARG